MTERESIKKKYINKINELVKHNEFYYSKDKLNFLRYIFVKKLVKQDI